MKKIAVIGLGNFGLNIARTLIANKCEVLGIDANPDVTNYSANFISHAINGDVSNKDVLEAINIRDFDAAVIAIGQDMAASILVALYLKELGVQRIVVRAISEDHGKILSRLGVNDVVFPEKDIAVKVANKLSLKNAVDYLPISDEYGIVEVAPPSSFMGKSLAELKITTTFNCQIIGIKYMRKTGKRAIDEEVIQTKIAPTAHDLITENCVMIVLGKLLDIEKLQNAH